MPKRKALSQPAARKNTRAAKEKAAEAIAEGDEPVALREERLAAMVAARKFWDGIATPYLYAWATDYETPAAKALQPQDRDGILRFLVETDGVELPAGRTAQLQHKALTACWRNFNKEGDPPAVEVAAEAPALRRSDTPPLNQEQELEERALLMGIIGQPLRETGAPAPLQAAPSPTAKGTTAPPPLALANPYQSGLPAPVPLALTRQCCTCGSFTTLPAGSAAVTVFFCGHCKQRGDLAFGDPLNIHLRAVAAGQMALAPVTAAAALSAGQSSNTALKSLSALDQCLIRMLAREPAMPIFTGGCAGDAIPFREALLLAARAFDAPKYKPPSEHLVALVRAGKLRDIGYALPRPLDSPGSVTDSESGSLSLSGGTVQFNPKAPAAPALASSQQLCMALLTTILPALIDKPRAMVDWMTLGRTALALEAAHGWPVASLYLQRELSTAVEAGRSFAASVDPQVLLPIMLESRSLGGRPPQHNSSGGGAPGNNSARPIGRNACYNWNSKSPCAREPCQFLHVCLGCGSAGHRGQECPDGPVSVPGKRQLNTSAQSVQSRRSQRGPHTSASTAPASSH
jgi:hypothetical protein